MAANTHYNRGNMLVYVDAHGFQPSEAEVDRLIDGLDVIGKQVADFPQHDVRLYLDRGARNNEYSVKVSVLLPGRTVVASDHNGVLHAAYEKCLGVVEGQLKAYKESLGGVAERRKLEGHTHQELVPSVPVDAAAVDAAAADGDYGAFRAALLPYEDGLRTRVGRWIERYPEVQARIGRGMEAVDVMEGVFLAAFEGYDQKPVDERFGDWLVTLIDPTVRAIAHHPDAELENINMARTAADAGALGELGGTTPGAPESPAGNPRPFAG